MLLVMIMMINVHAMLACFSCICTRFTKYSRKVMYKIYTRHLLLCLKFKIHNQAVSYVQVCIPMVNNL